VSAMDGVEAAAEKADIHSDISCDAPLVSSLPVTVASPVTRPITNYVPLSPICTSEFCGKHPMRLGCGRGFSFSLYVAPRLCLADVSG
jgi:hypothetical protein